MITSFTDTATSGHTAGTQYLKKRRTRRGKQTSQAPLEEKVCFPKGLLLEQKKVFFFFTGNKYNIANQAYSNKQERKIEKVIVKKISTSMATVRSREILTESQKQDDQALLCNEVQGTRMGGLASSQLAGTQRLLLTQAQWGMSSRGPSRTAECGQPCNQAVFGRLCWEVRYQAEGGRQRDQKMADTGNACFKRKDERRAGGGPAK